MARKSTKKLNLDLEGQPDPKTPLDWQAFLAAAAPVMKTLKDDLRARAKASPSVAEALHARHEAEKDEKRTADSFVEWQDHFVEQVAAAWMLSCVFVRTLEDRGLLGHARIAGPGASDSLRLFLDLAPHLNERDYLLTVFRELTRFAATKDLFDARHNPVWLLTPSAEGAKALVRLFQQPRADLPAFRFGQSDTSFLGWVYQDLDEDVRARYALLQTPRFIESFILDRTLEPAIEKFGLDDTTLIDPTCGSGHFLLGAFERLVAHRLRKSPGMSAREAAQKALDAVYGADLNPYAVAIARFRLTLAFFDKAGFERLTDAPAPPLHVVVADSLLHNPHLQQGELGDFAPSSKLWKGEELALENEAEARAVLFRQFSAVVGNPPYITVKDAVLRERYRAMYARSAAGKYSIAAPFTERFFQLARKGGRVGMITANSFMKREFGKKLIEQYLPTVNLDLVINTSGAYIPGHGTPTVLLFGSHETARGDEVSTVLASRGEPSTPDNAEQGLVWRSIADHWSQSGFENEYISVTKTARDALSKHPWSLGGGGAAELKELLEERAEKRLGEVAIDIGISAVTGEDDVYFIPAHAAVRQRVGRSIPLVTGEFVRDWSLRSAGECIFPYTTDMRVLPLSEAPQTGRYLWPFRTVLRKRRRFGTPMIERGLSWYELQELYVNKLRTPLSITFAFVATHNHFVLDRGGKVFNRSAPIIKLPATATEDDHLALLAYLNSSTACFWMKQVFQSRGYGADSANARTSRSTWEDFYEFAGTGLQSLPLPRGWQTLSRFGRSLDTSARELAAHMPSSVVISASSDLPNALAIAKAAAVAILKQMAALQEALDWETYRLFALHDDPELSAEDSEDVPGARSFERTHWTQIGGQGPDVPWWTRARVEPPTSAPSSTQRRRAAASAKDPSLCFIETLDYKRRWQASPWEEELEAAVEQTLLDEAEDAVKSGLTSARAMSAKLEVRDVPQQIYDLANETRSAEVRGLVAEGSVPFLAAQRLSSTGMTKLGEWERTWDLQRREDAGQTVGPIPVPPKYAQVDFLSARYYQLRGPLDVPKERFISYPGCESDQDHEPVYGWAGWDNEQRAKALATLYWNRKTEESWSKDSLTPMLAGLLELLPWLKQWHAEPSDDYAGDSPATYYAGFLDAECRGLGLTHEDLRSWRPAEKTRGRKAATPKADEAGADEAPKPAPKKRTKKAAPTE